MRELHDDFMSVVKTAPQMQYHNQALLYMSKATFEDIRMTLVREPGSDHVWRMPPDPIASMFGIPIMQYYAVEYGRWELIERGTGAYINSGVVWKGETSVRVGKRHVVDQFAAAVKGALEEDMKNADEGFISGARHGLWTVGNLADQFAVARQGQDHFAECCFNPFSPHHKVNH